LRDCAGDAAGGAYFGEIAGAAQQAVGDARRSTAAAGDFFGAAFIHFDGKNLGGAMQDDEEIVWFVKFEPMDYAEAGTEWCGDESGASGGTD
jgi:hypothetical protein